MSAPTPGPWKVMQGFHEWHVEQDVPCGGARIVTINRSEDGDSKHRGLALPDARLIAAAPELLAILEQVVNVMGHDTISQRITHDQIHAAIAKARGNA